MQYNETQDNSLSSYKPQTTNLSQTTAESSCQDPWNLKDNNLIQDFMKQCQTIETLASETSTLSELNFEQNGFDDLFFKSLQRTGVRGRGKIHRESQVERAKVSFLKNTKQEKRRDNRLKQKWNYRMITFCKSLRFFNNKSNKIQCHFCEKSFTSTAMGGHMSTNHKHHSTKFKNKTRISKRRSLIKKTNRRFKAIE
jgi:hypothetical protein